MGSVVVLDLDESLVHACSRKDCGNYTDQEWNSICEFASKRCRANQIHCFFTDNMFVFVRPKSMTMLQNFRKIFEFIVIFTAGNKSHANYIEKMLFEQAASVKVDFVFHRENCGKFDSSSKKTTLTPYQKNLSHIREIVESCATNEQKCKINWEDCLFIDDLAVNAVTNCGETLIIPKFDYPCLLSLLKSEFDAEVDIEEAAKDDILDKLVTFVNKKTSMENRVLWYMIDKRFAMFF